MNIFTTRKIAITRPINSTSDVGYRCGTRVQILLFGFPLFSYFRNSKH